MQEVKFKRMPWLLHKYFVWQGCADTWVTFPHAIYVDRGRWETYLNSEWEWLREHEMKHFERVNSRPWLSRWGWCIRYMLSWRMRYDEEVVAIKKELSVLPPIERQAMAWRESWNLVRSYGIKLPQQQVYEELTR